MERKEKKYGILIMALLLAAAVLVSLFALPAQAFAAENSYTGLKKEKNKLVYYKDGKRDTTARTLARVNGKGPWYYVKDGVVDRKKSGLYKIKGVYYCIKKGKLNKKYTGLYKKKGKLYYLTKGKQNTKYKGLVKNGTDYYYVENGMWNKKYKGKATIKGYPKPFKVTKGKVSGGKVPPTAKLAKAAEKVLKKNGYDLYSAFRWSVMPYVVYDSYGSAGLAHYASYGLQNHVGNCYVMAGTFCVLARQLGYEAYQVSGYVPGLYVPLTPHSWVEVKVKGKWYVCDPDFTEENGGNGFKIWYGTPGTWMYANYYRMGN